MKKTINMQHEANIQAEGKLNSKHCKPIICIETGEVFSSVTDAAECAEVTITMMSGHLGGYYRSVKGKHYCYLSRVNESLNTILTRLRETSAVEEDAKKWKAYEAEQEAKRIAEQKRQEEVRIAKEKHDAAINKAKEKVARAQGIHDTLAAKLNEAADTLMRAQRELEALEDKEV